MSVYEHSLTTIDGKPEPLSKYEGKVLLIVNVASECGFTPQYAGLQNLHSKYAGSGLVVLGVPSNDFGAQEPGSEEQIQQFCKTNYSVTFPMMSKVGIKYEPHPLYQYLQSEKGDVEWNFTKFLVSRSGDVVARFPSDVAPDSDKLVSAIVAEL